MKMGLSLCSIRHHDWCRRSYFHVARFQGRFQLQDIHLNRSSKSLLAVIILYSRGAATAISPSSKRLTWHTIRAQLECFAVQFSNRQHLAGKQFVNAPPRIQGHSQIFHTPLGRTFSSSLHCTLVRSCPCLLPLNRALSRLLASRAFTAS